MPHPKSAASCCAPSCTRIDVRLVRRRGWRLGLALAVAGLAGCSQVKVLEDTPASVSLRYGGTVTEDDALAEASRLCAAHGKVAQLRSSDSKGLVENYANFNCVSR